MTPTLGFLQNIGVMEWVIILIIMLLLFGRRLPEVGKSLGKGIVEFRKGLKNVDEEADQSVNRPQWQQNNYQQQLPPPGAQTSPSMPPAQQPVSRADKVE